VTDIVTATEAPPLLEIRGLRKVYGGTVALADVDLTIRAGEIHALLGENGAGKSTLVRILAAVDHEDGGSIALAGEPLPAWHYLESGDRDAVHRAGVSVVGKVISEVLAGPLENHIVSESEWDGEAGVPPRAPMGFRFP